MFKNNFYELCIHNLCSFCIDCCLFIGLGGRALYVLDIPFLDMSFKLLLLISLLMLLMVCFPVCHLNK